MRRTSEAQRHAGTKDLISGISIITPVTQQASSQGKEGHPADKLMALPKTSFNIHPNHSIRYKSSHTRLLQQARQTQQPELGQDHPAYSRPGGASSADKRLHDENKQINSSYHRSSAS